jgi:hypothetical protein
VPGNVAGILALPGVLAGAALRAAWLGWLPDRPTGGCLLHNEEVCRRERVFLANRALVPQTGPLTWVPTLDGYQLAGCHLPATATAASGDFPGPGERLRDHFRRPGQYMRMAPQFDVSDCGRSGAPASQAVKARKWCRRSSG